MINNFKTIIFDCDGVILNYNQVKKEAYYKVALSHYGEKYATSLVEYLANNTGKTRGHFFNHFLTNIVPQKALKTKIDDLVSEVTAEINKGLIKCEISQSLFDLRKNTLGIKWLIISGGVESELKDIFLKRSLFDLFDGGIYGGPMTKDEILESLIKENNIEFPALFLGDSKYDHEVAERAELDFLFISGWTDFKEWQNYCNVNKITSIKSLSDLI